MLKISRPSPRHDGPKAQELPLPGRTWPSSLLRQAIVPDLGEWRTEGALFERTASGKRPDGGYSTRASPERGEGEGAGMRASREP